MRASIALGTTQSTCLKTSHHTIKAGEIDLFLGPDYRVASQSNLMIPAPHHPTGNPAESSVLYHTIHRYGLDILAPLICPCNRAKPLVGLSQKPGDNIRREHSGE